MSYIVRTGNLAKTPTLREGQNGPYLYARILVHDRYKEGDQFIDGPVTAYDVEVTGQLAHSLHRTATESGNVRVTFSGDYTVRAYRVKETGEVRTSHKVRADEISVSLRNQHVSVIKTPSTADSTGYDPEWGAPEQVPAAPASAPAPVPAPAPAQAPAPAPATPQAFPLPQPRPAHETPWGAVDQIRQSLQ